MHWYEPPANASTPRGPYALGDFVVFGGALVGLSVAGAVVRRVLRLSRR
jgi:hypothetical protein